MTDQTPQTEAGRRLRLACHDMHQALWGGVDPRGHNVNPDGTGAGDCYKCDRLADALEASQHYEAQARTEALDVEHDDVPYPEQCQVCVDAHYASRAIPEGETDEHDQES